MYTGSLYFYLTILCNCVTGLIPPVTNPAGQRPYVRYSELSCCYAMVRAAVLCSHKTQLHEHQRKSQNTNERMFLAFPNDRAASLRPADANTEYRCALWLQSFLFFFCSNSLAVKCDILYFFVYYMQDNLYWYKTLSLYRCYLYIHCGRGEAETAACTDVHKLSYST